MGYEQLATGSEVKESFDTALGGSWTVDIPGGSTGTATVTGGNLVIDVPTGQDTASDSRGAAPIVYRALPGSPADFELTTTVTQGTGDRGAAGIVVLDATTGLPAIQLEYISRLNFRLLAGGDSKGSKVSLSRSNYSLRLVRDGLAKTWTGYYRLSDTDDWTEVGVATDGIDDTPIVSSPLVGLYGRTPTSTMTASFANFDITIPDQRPVYGPEIGLNVQTSMQNKNGSIYMRMPFTYAGDPTQLDELALTARFDDGFIAYLNGTELTRQNSPIQEAWNSSTDAEFGAVNGQIPIRQYIVSAALGSLKQGQNVLAVHGMNVAKDDLDFFFDAQMLGSDILSETEQFFITPTPGASNELPAAPTPEIIGQQGVFFGSRTIEMRLSNPVPSLEIRYTLDGSVPTPNSTLYTGPLTLNASAMLQARTFDSSPTPSFARSNAASGTFMAIDPALQTVTSDLPMVVLSGLGQALAGAGSNDLTAMNVVVFDTSKVDGRSSLGSNLIDYLGRGGARDRGSSTAGQPKPNMAFELWGETGTTQDNDEAASLLGMPSDSDWVLHAPYNFDRPMMHNQLAFDLSRDMGMWASNYRLVEVYIDSSPSDGKRPGDGVITDTDYMGVYVLMEKIDRDNDKVDVAPIDPSDNAADPNDPLKGPISGGYIWKIDRADPDAPAFSAGGTSLNWVYPKSPSSRTAREDQKATAEQQKWVQDYFNAFNATLRSPDINDPEGYSKYIVPENWADHHMLNVLMMNVDAFRLSGYFYKDRDGRVEYGPVWDFDRALESTDDRDDDPFHWRAQTGDLGTDFFGKGSPPPWWGDLFKDPGFWQVYIDRWQMWREDVLSDARLESIVDSMAAQLNESQARNFQKFPANRPRTSSGYKGNVLNGTYQGEVDNMKKWLLDRAHFMDSNFAQRAQVLVKGQALGTVDGALVSPGEQIDITPPPLEFFIDTKLVNGDAGSTSATYFIPGDDTLGTSWAARNFNDSAWPSGPLGYGYDDGTDFTELVKTEVNPNAAVPGSTTALIRVPFQVTDLTQAQANRLVLKMKYDDGFVAYLNGERVLDRNLRDTDLAWNSRASSRRDSDAVIFEEHDISKFSNLLVQGTNVLAIRAINSTATSNDLLSLPELISRQVDFGVNPNAKVYYTTDGTDPRGTDGQPSASAQLLQGGGKLTVNGNTRVIARNFDDSFRGTESNIVLTNWSGPVQYDLVTATPSLVISEINYNPADPKGSELGPDPLDPLYKSDDFEFIELQNVGSTSVNLVGVKLTDGVDFDFYTSNISSIAPGGRVVVVSNPTAFALRYGNNIPVAGQYQGNLNNNGEDVDLRMGTGDVIFSVSFGDSDPWPATANGLGASLELINASVPSNQQSKWYSWRSSTEYGGTPGTAGAGSVGIVINEVLAHTDPPVQLTDSIELHNTTNALINIGGWFLSDSTNNLFAFEIPAGTNIPAGGYVVFNEAQFNAPNDDEGFGLSGLGDDLYLVRGTKATGTISHFVDDVHFRATLNGESLGRIPNGDGRLSPLTRNTLGTANVNPRVGPLVISEVQFNPLLSPQVRAAFPTIEESDLEFVEVYNPTNTAVTLTNWRLRGGADFDFPDGYSLAAGKTAVILKFDPTNPENANELNAFRMAYGINQNVSLLGGYAGQLNNSDDQLLLLRPDAPVDTTIPHVQEDEVLYDDLAPWPTNADGTGKSLQRKQANAFGNDGQSWYAGAATPGSISTSLPGDMDGNGVVDAEDINAMFAQMKSANPDLSYDLNGDSQVDETDRDILVEDLIGTSFGDSDFDGIFNSSDLVFVLIAGEYEDNIAGNSKWQTGDWNGDGEFSTGDFVLALTKGGYSAAAMPGNRSMIAAATMNTSNAIQPTLDDQSETVLVENMTRPRPLWDAVDQTVDSLFAEAPVHDTADTAADDLVDALLNDGREWS